MSNTKQAWWKRALLWAIDIPIMMVMAVLFFLKWIWPLGKGRQ